MPMLKYQHAASRQSLREALAELRAAEGDVSVVIEPALASALEAHDVVHVLFGLDISEIDEVVAHVWMLRGTTLEIAEIHAIMQHRDHRRLAHNVGHARRVKLVLRAAPRLCGALWRSRRMHKKWPWADYARYVDVPLDEIRREYGIVLPNRPCLGNMVRGPHHGRAVART